MITHNITCTKHYDNEFVYYKKQACNIAKQLSYSDEVIQKVKDASSIAEISSIMRNARTNGESAIHDNYFNQGTAKGLSGLRRVSSV